MRHATYVGPLEQLREQRALIIDDPKDCTNPPGSFPAGYVLAQFDSIGLRLDLHGPQLGFGWHAFPAKHFRYDGEEPTS